MDSKYENQKFIIRLYNKCSRTNSQVDTIVIDTPIGSMVLIACGFGLHSIRHESTTVDENFTPNLSSLMNVRRHHLNSSDLGTDPIKPIELDSENSNKEVDIDIANVHLNKAVKWLRTYFGNNVASGDLPLKEGKHEFCFEHSTEFERKVWLTLLERTHKGETITYRQLAEKSGCPKGSRAVGSAMKKNPILILIPCHRVIRSDGSLGNYNGGTCKKEFLQKIEKDFCVKEK